MKQPRINNLADLFVAGTKASGGAGAHALALNLTVGTKLLIDGDLNQFSAAFDAHQAAVVLYAENRTALKNARKVAFEFNFGSRDALRRSLGRKYSSAWEGSGFANSLTVPRSTARVQLLTRSLQSYLADHPVLEVENAITSVLAQTALDNLTNAQTAVDLQKSAVGTLLTARKQKEKQLRLRLSWVIDELSRVMGPMDDRWTAFGFNKPGLQQAPDRPQKVSVVTMGAGYMVKWKKSARAEYYRLWMRVVGVSEVLVPIGTASDLSFLIESVPPASQVEIAVSAVNNGGESAFSEVVPFATV